MKTTKWSALLLLAVTTFTACNSNNNDTDNEERVREVVVETLPVESRTFEERIRVTGTVEAIEDAMISAEASGRVQRIVDRGSQVGDGTVLVELDDRMVRSSLEIARANYELAEDALQRQEPLLQDSIISTLEFNQARSQRDQARSQLEQAEKQLSDSRITAPFRGTVEDRMVNTGELVNPGVPVLRLVNIERVRINAGVPERYINDIQSGTPVTVSLASYSGELLQSEVSYRGSVIVPETRTFPIEVILENGDGLLNPEMVVNLSIVRQVWEDALVVPRTALVRDEDGLQLYVVTERDGREVAEARRVRTGPASGALILIEEGISSGDRIIVTGQSNVSDGDYLRIQNQLAFERYQLGGL